MKDISEEQRNRQIKEAKETAEEMMDSFNTLKGKLNEPEFKDMRNALDKINFSDSSSAMNDNLKNIHKVMGAAIEKMANNDSRVSK